MLTTQQSRTGQPKPGRVHRALLQGALRFASTRFGGWFFTTITPSIDRYLLTKSSGRFSVSGLAIPTLLLTTKGRRTGKPRSTPLIYLLDDSVWVVIGSKGGRATHPAWYLNILANDVVTVTLDGSDIPCTAQEIHGSSRELLWSQFAKIHPGFNTYQSRVNRQIPVITLRPVPPS